jgi:hypothetical protein
MKLFGGYILGVAILVIFAGEKALAELQKSDLSTNPIVYAGSNGSPGSSGNGLTIIDEKTAREKLAKKLEKLNKGADMKVATDPNSAGGGKSFNSNDGNSFLSNTTYHSYVWSYCMKWAGPRQCDRWLDPYVSVHGTHGDRSPLEETVYNAWNAKKKEGDQGEGGKYAIWDVKATRPILDPETGRLDMTAINSLSLQSDVKEKVEKVGYDTASRQIRVTYDENAGKGDNTMPNMESLRMMASRWTDMLRRRLVSIRGESLASQKGIEFALGEDIEDCKAYLYQVKNDPPTDDPEEQEKRIKPQGPLSLDTTAMELEDRAKRCQMMMAASVYKPQKGEDRVDAWRARVNVAAIDYAGIDPNSIPRPQGTQLTEEETTQEVATWSEGGTDMQVERTTAAQELQEYNKQLAIAAGKMREIASVSPNIPDASEQIQSYKIESKSGVAA